MDNPEKLATLTKKTQHNMCRTQLHPNSTLYNVNQTWAVIHTTGGKDEPNIIFMRKSYRTSQHSTQSVKTNNRTTRDYVFPMTKSVEKPIYKNKGDKMNPKNFRPITILSCLSKLFTAVLSERLTKFSDAFLLLNENQCGFRKGYSTIYNLFIIHSLFEILKFKKKKMFCAFIDFEKAFDTVCRDALWYNYHIFFLPYISMILNPS